MSLRQHNEDFQTDYQKAFSVLICKKYEIHV